MRPSPDSERGDVPSALQFASGRLPFRAGASKSLVLVTCSGNPAEGDGAFFGDALTVAKEQNITLHRLSEEDVAYRRKPTSPSSSSSSSSSSKGRVLGYSRDQAFTSAHMSLDAGSAALKRQLRPAKDYLSALALETGGSVFSLGPLSRSQRRSHKVAGTVFARRVSSRAEPSPCQVCDCVPDPHGGSGGQVQCHRCILPQVDIVQENWERHRHRNVGY